MLSIVHRISFTKVAAPCGEGPSLFSKGINEKILKTKKSSFYSCFPAFFPFPAKVWLSDFSISCSFPNMESKTADSLYE
jgi:hypothetical protein